jgi:hypothetical protein
MHNEKPKEPSTTSSNTGSLPDEIRAVLADLYNSGVTDLDQLAFMLRLSPEVVAVEVEKLASH